MRGVVVHMGGFYEYLYYCLKNERAISPYEELRPVMDAFMQSLGYTPKQTAEALDAHFPKRRRIEDAVALMEKSLPV